MCEEENILTLDKLNNFMAMTGLFKKFITPYQKMIPVGLKSEQLKFS